MNEKIVDFEEWTIKNEELILYAEVRKKAYIFSSIDLIKKILKRDKKKKMTLWNVCIHLWKTFLFFKCWSLIEAFCNHFFEWWLFSLIFELFNRSSSQKRENQLFIINYQILLIILTELTVLFSCSLTIFLILRFYVKNSCFWCWWHLTVFWHRVISKISFLDL